MIWPTIITGVVLGVLYVGMWGGLIKFLRDCVWWEWLILVPLMLMVGLVLIIVVFAVSTIPGAAEAVPHG